jgi:hypothetical protein
MKFMLLPPWAQIGIPLLIVALIFGAGFKVASWRCSGKLAKAEATADAATKAAAEATAFRAACITDLKNIGADLLAMDERRAAAEVLYQEAVARPPEVVIEYEERWHTIRETVQSEECHVALGELYDWLHTLPAYAAAGGAP